MPHKADADEPELPPDLTPDTRVQVEAAIYAARSQARTARLVAWVTAGGVVVAAVIAFFGGRASGHSDNTTPSPSPSTVTVTPKPPPPVPLTIAMDPIDTITYPQTQITGTVTGLGVNQEVWLFSRLQTDPPDAFIPEDGPCVVDPTSNKWACHNLQIGDAGKTGIGNYVLTASVLTDEQSATAVNLLLCSALPDTTGCDDSFNQAVPPNAGNHAFTSTIVRRVN